MEWRLMTNESNCITDVRVWHKLTKSSGGGEGADLGNVGH